MAVDHVSLDIHEGEVFGLLGTKWCGQDNNNPYVGYSAETNEW